MADLIAGQYPASETGVEISPVFDDQGGHYLLLKVGWHHKKRVRATTVYVRLRNGKFWVEEDLTENGIATDLQKAGVPAEDIVLAFLPPESRLYTQFATA
jgi:hypothetical protein